MYIYLVIQKNHMSQHHYETKPNQKKYNVECLKIYECYHIYAETGTERRNKNIHKLDFLFVSAAKYKGHDLEQYWEVCRLTRTVPKYTFIFKDFIRGIGSNVKGLPKTKQCKSFSFSVSFRFVFVFVFVSFPAYM